ncbi:MAG: sortase [bacterium]|nr:sortase [bacterium]
MSVYSIQKPINTRGNKPKIYPVVIATTLFFFVAVNVLVLLGLVPEITEASLKLNIGSQPVDIVEVEIEAEIPQRIVIPALKMDAPIFNPVQSDKVHLDQALLQGIVRYPGSGMLGKKGNVVLMGHSSHLSYVRNKAYQAFNEINTLEKGQEIILYGPEKTYRYLVTSVRHVKSSKEILDLRTTDSKLTLITCNNFGTKEDRYIIEALLIN